MGIMRSAITRRGFMKGGALALVGTSAIPGFLTRSVMAEMTNAVANKKKLVVLFQRGAADGLNIVVPYQEKNYYAMRPSIAIQKNQVLDLDGLFGLHPAMASFKPLYDQGHLAIIHAAGSPDMSRSHFDAQDYMESGTPGVKVTEDGWLNRALQGEMLTGKPSSGRASPCAMRRSDSAAALRAPSGSSAMRALRRGLIASIRASVCARSSALEISRASNFRRSRVAGSKSKSFIGRSAPSLRAKRAIWRPPACGPAD